MDGTCAGLPWSSTPGTAKTLLGEIEAYVQNAHRLPLPDELMRVRASRRGPRCRSPLCGQFRTGKSPSLASPSKPTATHVERVLLALCTDPRV
jgi:hypothetical protein